ncbi:stage III sporulation protein AE [Clostridium sp. CAG:389]|nr:stage III sporulation protein AE [Clostridium sp. CAG:389]
MNKQMKIILMIIIMVISVLSPRKSYCANDISNTQSAISIDENELESQEKTFGISSFIQNSKQYTGEFFEDIDISDILNSAIKGEIDNSNIYKKILSKLGNEVQNGVKSLACILAIIIIHSILKSISESLENDNISKLIYYVQYIAIITVIMSNFSDIITLVKDTTTNLIGFMNTLIPVLISLMLYTGSITTTSILEPIILFMINFIGNLIQDILMPIILIITSISIISKISDRVQIDKISKFLKSSTIWFLGIVLTIFVGVVSLEGTLASSVDGITAKTAKAIVSSAVPIVGKILGDVVDSVLGCGLILKNAVGFVGVIVIIGICIMPILKLTVLTFSYKLVASISEVIADSKIVKLLDEIGDIFKILLAILVTVTFMVIIGTTLLVKMSNTGMMFR